MPILTVNPGSNSLRLDLVASVDTTHPRVLDAQHTSAPPMHDDSLAVFDEFLAKHSRDLSCVAHRVVHGGEHIQEPHLVREDTVDLLTSVEPLAPQHVPATLALVRRVARTDSLLAQVLCPDTGFHATLPAEATAEPLPARWRSEIRRFGFHGLSYAWALRRTAELLHRPGNQVNALVAHLGGGCSACAIHQGRSVDTTMGFTPLGGLAMSRRSGDLDPGALFWLLRQCAGDIDAVERVLYRESGLFGLSNERSDDTRELVAAAARGDEVAQFALTVFARKAASGLAGMATNLDSFDAIVFTGEIGWNQPEVRRDVCRRLSLLGVSSALSGNRDDDGFVSQPEAVPPVLIIKPREELQMATEAHHVLSGTD